MQKSIFIVLLILFSLPLALKTGKVIYFKWNEKEIASTLCENRFKKASTCNGTCYLKKQLKKTDQSSTSETSTRFEDNFQKLVYFIEPLFQTEVHSTPKYTINFPTPSTDGQVKDFSLEIEYPRCC
jgi:hypothetical protein